MVFINQFFSKVIIFFVFAFICTSSILAQGQGTGNGQGNGQGNGNTQGNGQGQVAAKAVAVVAEVETDKVKFVFTNPNDNPVQLKTTIDGHGIVEQDIVIFRQDNTHLGGGSKDSIEVSFTPNTYASIVLNIIFQHGGKTAQSQAFVVDLTTPSVQLLEVFPNPISNGYLNIELPPANEQKEWTLSVYNLSGQLQLSKNFTQSGNYRLAIDALKTGYYMLELKATDAAIVYRNKLVVN